MGRKVAAQEAADKRKTALLKKLTSQVKTRLNEMRERNIKLSRADTNARSCEKHLARRRRTCLCPARRRRGVFDRRRRWYRRRRGRLAMEKKSQDQVFLQTG